MLKQVVESERDEARQYLLVNVIETYFHPGRRQREQFGKVVARKEYAKVQDTELTWGDELLLKGEVRGKRETLKRQLTAKFGPLPKEAEARLDAIQSGEKLDQYLDRVL
ncbi:MAG TPA: hypothetical protein VEK15_20300, partial [Vicinamibacteria bacterium]|nr:hypothetical protein [Vicinamibacteria bacterium]